MTNGITTTLEVAFGAAMFAASPTWTDLSAAGLCIDEVEIEGGWGDTDEHASATTLRATLANGDNRFDPDNASSPYYPYLIRDQQVRFSGTLGSTYRRFVGWVERWEINEGRDGENPIVILHAVDVLGLAARFTEPTVGFRRKVLSWSPAPSAYWRVGDGDSASTAYDETGNRRFAVHGLGSRERATGLLTADGDGATSLDATRVVVGTTQVGLTGTSHGVFLLIKPNALPVTGTDRIFNQDVGGGLSTALRLSSTGAIQLTSGGMTVISTVLVAPDQTVAIGFRRAGSSWTLGVDVGAGVNTYAGTEGTSATANWPVFGGRRSGEFISTFDGDIDEIVVWHNVDPGSTMLSTLSDLALRPGHGEAGVTRFGALLDRIGFPVARRTTVYEGFYEAWPLGPYVEPPPSVLAAMHKLSDTQHARVYGSRSGDAAYLGHRLPSTSFTPAVTFSDDGSAVPIDELVASRGELSGYTRVTADDGAQSATVGTQGVADNDLSIEVYPGLLTDLPADSALRRYRDANQIASRVDLVSVRLGGMSTSDKQAVLALDLTSPVRVLRHPSAGGTRTYDGEIRHRREVWTDAECRMEFALSAPGAVYAPSARATHSAHRTVANSVVNAPALDGERWDDDSMHPSQLTAGGSFANGLYLHPDNRHLLVAQTWWEGGTIGVRELSVTNGVGGTIEARVRDRGINNGTAHLAGVLRQTPAIGPGDPVAWSQMTVRHTQGADLQLFAAPLGDANWAFAPDFTAVRIPSAARACRATKTAAASITSTASPAAGQTLIQWDGTDRFDVGSMHDPASNNSRITVGKTGTFFALATLGIESSSAGSRMASLRRNGSSTIARGGCLPPTSEDAYLQVAGLWKMTATTDYVECLGWQDSGAGKNLLKSSPTTPEFMAVELVQSCRAHKTSSPSINNDTDTQLSFEAEVWDDAGCFTPGGSAMTVQWDGPTLIGGQLSWSGNGTGDRWVWLVVNGVVVAQLRVPALTSGAETPQCPWTIWDCRVGDQVTMWVRQSSGAGLAIQSAADYASDMYIAQIATGP